MNNSRGGLPFVPAEGDPHRPAPWLIAAIPMALIFTIAAVMELLRLAPIRDFGAFYAGGVAWWTGAPWYSGSLPGRPNLNPPLVVLVFCAPLARLSLSTAVIVWSIAGAVVLGLTLRAIQRALQLSPTQTIAMAVLLLWSFPSRVIWAEGQIVWFLLYPLTRAWIASREGRHLHAGVWLAPVIAAKPILALLPLALALPTLIVAGGGSLAIALVGIAITGWQPWADWLATSAQITWFAKPDNLSIWGVFARAIGVRADETFRLGLLPAPLFVVAAVGAAGMLTVAWRARQDADRRWVLAGILTLAFSPLGWAYYLPLQLGPLTALCTRPSVSRWTWAGLVLLMLPMGALRLILDLAWPITGSFYSGALLCLAYGVSQQRAGVGDQAVVPTPRPLTIP